MVYFLHTQFDIITVKSNRITFIIVHIQCFCVERHKCQVQLFWNHLSHFLVLILLKDSFMVFMYSFCVLFKTYQVTFNIKRYIHVT